MGLSPCTGGSTRDGVELGSGCGDGGFYLPPVSISSPVEMPFPPLQELGQLSGLQVSSVC